MANPYLPNWEYIPDGEPRVFGDRIYVYGSHDRKDSIDFCDYKLKVWSAPVSDPTKWVCHGDIFRSRDGHDSPSDVDWTDELLFAPGRCGARRQILSIRVHRECKGLCCSR